MLAFLQLSTATILGYLCAAAGFLIIVASVVFVIKGKATLGESGAPNTFQWSRLKATFTSVVALFVLGAVMIALPFWRFQQKEAQEPATALLRGKMTGTNGKDVRLLIVAKPDYDQTYRDDIVWEFPLLAKKASYSVFYVADGTILFQRPFRIESAAPGTALREVALGEVNLQVEGTPAREIKPKLEVGDEELKSLGIN